MRRLGPTLLLISSMSLSAPALAQVDASSDTAGVIEIEPTSPDEATPEEARAGDETAEPPAVAPEVQPSRALADRLAGEAEQAFGDGDFNRAIDLLQQAYDADQNPNMLYNIARVHEELGNLDDALDFYRRFVVAPNVDLDYRREALQSSEILEQTLAAKAAAGREAEVAQRGSTTEQTEPRMLRPAPFPTTSSMRPMGFTLAAVGGVAVLAGAAVGIVALQKESQFIDAGSLAERRAAGSSARDLATAADALYISGTVLVVTGLVTAFASPRRERPQALGAIDVTVSSDGAGAAWTLRF